MTYIYLCIYIPYVISPPIIFPVNTWKKIIYFLHRGESRCYSSLVTSLIFFSRCICMHRYSGVSALFHISSSSWILFPFSLHKHFITNTLESQCPIPFTIKVTMEYFKWGMYAYIHAHIQTRMSRRLDRPSFT